MNNRAVGAEYESLACRYLEQQGMRIIERNYRVRIGEIDIIAADGDTLVFAEVKYRSARNWGGAQYAISAAKQRRIMSVAKWYMAVNHISRNTICRFDAVLIDHGEITLIKNAWQC